ncbi:cardiolipin synthase [Pseudaeromonas paramecii]|uniref:Cardiolipin synthase A n=1 Tax=Pseudaeromonas paramecii TaxID=2138166 RepID=A0ABP8Q5Q1_9GAMM
MQGDWDLLKLAYEFLGWLLFAGYLALMVGISVRVVMKRRPIGVSLAWLFLIYILPGLGIVGYLLFGEIRLGRKRVERAKAMYSPYARWIRELVRQFAQPQAEPSHQAQPLVELVEARLGSPLLKGNRLALLTEPNEILFALARDIQASRVSCFLEFYIWQPGGWVDEVAEALIGAAGRGVECRVLLDSVGSAAFFKTDWPSRLTESGVHLVEVLPVGAWRIPLQRQDLRMHRKLVVIDDQVAYTGSMNLVDPRFFKRGAGVGQWIDIMVRLQGPVVPLFWSLFVQDWEMETGERLLEAQQHNPEYLKDPDQQVQLVPSGPFTGGDCIQQILLQSIYQARHTLVFTTPYFVPDDPLVAALQVAAERGVRVQLILPAKNDSLMVTFASQAFFEELLASGVEIYRFHDGLLHTKSVLVDDALALVGTVNLDRRSLWLNFEATLLVDDPGFAGELARVQQDYLRRARPMSWQQWRQRSRWHRLRENLFYLLSPLL